jgi:hypothetical protein
MSKYILITGFIFLAACSSQPPTMSSDRVGFVPKTLTVIYLASYDYTWNAALKEMQRYQLSIVNKEAGTIITDETTAYSDRYETTASINNLDPRGKVKYNFDVRVKELAPTPDSIPQTEISILKSLVRTNEFGVKKPIPSDLIDEKVILHRIKRLLEIERLKLERNRK